MNPRRRAGAHESRCPKKFHPLLVCGCLELDHLETMRVEHIATMRPTVRIVLEPYLFPLRQA